jgi:protein-arginine kinase activator protein McsA
MDDVVIFDRKDLGAFDIEMLRKMMMIQIESEKYEGAAIIRDEIEVKKNKLNSYFDKNDDEPELS